MRKRNVVRQGWPEKSNETWKDLEKVVGDLFGKLGIPDKPDFDDCYRMGRFSSTKCRPIMLKLLRQRDKKQIMSRRKYLKGTSIFVNDDNPRDVRKKLSILRTKEKELRREQPGAKIYTRNQTLFIRNGSNILQYSVNEDDHVIERPQTSTHAMDY
jgi:hypothetical protein